MNSAEKLVFFSLSHKQERNRKYTQSSGEDANSLTQNINNIVVFLACLSVKVIKTRVAK